MRIKRPASGVTSSPAVVTPPPIAAWLLRNLGPRYHAESLAGDVLEELQRGRSQRWYWRQTLAAVRIGVITRLTIRGKVSLKRLLGALWLTALTAGAIAWAGNAPGGLQHHLRTAAPAVSTTQAVEGYSVDQ